MGINMASRFDYQGKVTTNVNAQGKKKRKLDRPKETPVGPPKRLVQEQPRTRTYLPNPGQAPVAKKAPSGVSNVPQAKPKRMKPSVNAASGTRYRDNFNNPYPGAPSTSVKPTQAGLGRAAQARTSTGNGGLRAPRVSVSISNETAIGRGLNRIFTGDPGRTVEERRKRAQGIRERAGQ